MKKPDYRLIAWGVMFVIAGVWNCGGAKKGEVSPASSSRHQMEQRLQALQWDWEILQKDQPAQNETTGFRLALKRAEQNLAEGRLKAAGMDLAEAESWIAEARPRYYQQHQAAVQTTESKEDGETLMVLAREFWNRYRFAAEQGQEVLSRKYQTAALEQGELALLAYAGRRDRVLDYARLSLELAGWYRELGRESEAQRVAEQGRSAIQEEINTLTREISAAVAGQEKAFAPEQLRQSEENFEQARAELERRNQRLWFLRQHGLGMYPGQIQGEDQTARIQSWTVPYLQYFQHLAQQSQIKTPLPDPVRLAERERRRRQAVAELSQVCATAVPLSTPGLQITELLVEPRGAEVVIRGRISNYSGQTLYRLRMAVCGEIVASEVIDLNRPTLPDQNQENFTLPLAHFELGDFMTHDFKIGPHQLLLIYDDSRAVEHREYLAVSNN